MPGLISYYKTTFLLNKTTQVEQQQQPKHSSKLMTGWIQPQQTGNIFMSLSPNSSKITNWEHHCLTVHKPPTSCISWQVASTAAGQGIRLKC